jgi:hypothetical protein
MRFREVDALRFDLPYVACDACTGSRDHVIIAIECRLENCLECERRSDFLLDFLLPVTLVQQHTPVLMHFFLDFIFH